jgi:anti-anti-sigma factor
MRPTVALIMTDPVGFSVTVKDDPRPTIVVRGEIDLAAVSDMEEAVLQALPLVTECLVFDLIGCSYMDSSGLGVLIRARRRMPSGAQVILRRPDPRVMQVLEITKLDSVFTIEAE